jgi:hypothetical protein
MGEIAQQTELETGWLPTTPSGDTLLRRFLLNWGNACTANAQTFGGTAKEMPAVHMADSGTGVAFLNWAILQQPLLAETTPATLAELDDFYAFAEPTRHGGVLLQCLANTRSASVWLAIGGIPTAPSSACRRNAAPRPR